MRAVVPAIMMVAACAAWSGEASAQTGQQRSASQSRAGFENMPPARSGGTRGFENMPPAAQAPRSGITQGDGGRSGRTGIVQGDGGRTTAQAPRAGIMQGDGGRSGTANGDGGHTQTTGTIQGRRTVEPRSTAAGVRSGPRQEGTSCPAWMCGTSNGVSLNGQNLNGTEYHGVTVKSVRRSADEAQPAVSAVVLPSGEVVDLR